MVSGWQPVTAFHREGGASPHPSRTIRPRGRPLRVTTSSEGSLSHAARPARPGWDDPAGSRPDASGLRVHEDPQDLREPPPQPGLERLRGPVDRLDEGASVADGVDGDLE